MIADGRTRIRQLVSLVVGVAAIGYFVYFIGRTLSHAEVSTLLSSSAVIAILVAALAVVGSMVTTAWAWRRLLLERQVHVSARQLTMILGLTQLAKYLPGNVGHHLARAAVAYRHGVPAGDVAASLGLEAGLVIAAAVIVGASGYGTEIDPVGALLVILPCALAMYFLSPPRRAAFLAYILNFVTLGIGLFAIAVAVGSTLPPSAPVIAGAFALAWVAGFVVPGAPAGLGVREGVLVGLLTPVLGSIDVLSVVLGFRIATTVGDLASFAVGGVLYLQHSAAVDESRSTGLPNSGRP